MPGQEFFRAICASFFNRLLSADQVHAINPEEVDQN
jgi:hypothetical protein